MDPQIGWFQPEQGKRAKEFWMQIWDAHIFSRVNSKSNFAENNSNNVLSKFQENIENIPDSNRRLPPLNMNHLNSILNSMNKASTYYMNKFQHNLIGKYGGTPWRIRKSYDSNAIIGLHQEVEDFFVYMSPTPEEHQVRLGIIANVKSIILTLWPKAQVEVFGSFQTSLYLPTSDIDMVVIGEWEQLPLRTLQDALLSSGICEPDNIKVLDKASVPIVKFNDRLSDVKVDISFNMNNGVKSVELINHFCVQFPSLKKLVLVLKQFLLQRDLNEVFHGGISSYSLILMCISFLQLHTHQDPSRYDNNLGILLIEFFELYGRKFNYIRAAISIKNGGKYISKDELQKDMTDGHRPSILSIEDPLTQGNDIGRGSYGALQVKQAFEYAFMVITQAISLGIDSSQSSILGRIIRVTDRVVDYRSWLRTAFPIPKPPKSNDGSISSLQSADSDSESNHGHSNDLNTLPILPLPKFPRRTVNNGLRFPPSSVTGYVRGGDMNNFSILNHQHYHLYHHNQHHAIAADVPKIQNTAGAAALNITMNGAAGNHLNNNHHLPSNGFHHHHQNANQNRHHMNVHHNIYNNGLHNKVHMNNNNSTSATSGSGNNGNNANRYYSHTPYYNHRRIKSQQFVRHKTATNNNSNGNNDVAEENNNLR